MSGALNYSVIVIKMKNNIYIYGSKEKKHLIKQLFTQLGVRDVYHWEFKFEDCVYSIHGGYVTMQIAEYANIDPNKIKTIDEIYEEF